MPSKWSVDIEFKEVILKVEEKRCNVCGSKLVIRKDRIHHIYSLEGPLKLICKVACCTNQACPKRGALLNPKSELSITMPRWRMGWDIFLWMGFRRYKRHWSVSQIQAELLDSSQIMFSEDTITEYLRRYQLMVAARHQDVARLQADYHDCQDVILTIDGIQPEKGHETLYVVRELRKQRIWFAEALLSSTYAEIRKVIQRAKSLAQQLNTPVRGWVSDKQEAFVINIAAEFPNTPHRYCDNHFLRDLADGMLEKDSHAKVQMRRKIRGLRTIEKEILAELDHPPQEANMLSWEQRKYAIQIVLDYCAGVRGILNDNHGGPFNPPGWRMAHALEAIHDSLERNLDKPPTPISVKLKRLDGCIQRGLSIYNQEKAQIAAYVNNIKKVFETVNPANGLRAKRQTQFRQLTVQFATDADPITTDMSAIMKSFEVGLFVGSDDGDIPGDNLDLERWFKTPKGHERRIHGHQHVGIRMVCEGPTLLPALDAHFSQTAPFTYQDLLPYVKAEAPESQRRSLERHRIMKKARSKKNGQFC